MYTKHAFRELGIGARRRVLHLTYTRRDLPQQLTQRDYLTEGLYQRMVRSQRFLLNIEPSKRDSTVARTPEREGAKDCGISLRCLSSFRLR